MGDPKGNLVSPVLPNPSGALRTPEVDASDRQLVNDRGTPGANRQSNLSAAAGSNSLTSGAVPTGKAWRVHSICAFDFTSAINSIFIVANLGGTAVWINSKVVLAAQEPCVYHGQLFLDAGRVIMAYFGGCTLNDDIYLDIAYEEYDA